MASTFLHFGFGATVRTFSQFIWARSISGSYNTVCYPRPYTLEAGAVGGACGADYSFHMVNFYRGFGHAHTALCLAESLTEVVNGTVC